MSSIELPPVPEDNFDAVLDEMLAKLRVELDVVEADVDAVRQELGKREDRLRSLRKTEQALLKSLGATPPPQRPRVVGRAYTQVAPWRLDKARAWVAEQPADRVFTRVEMQEELGWNGSNKIAMGALAHLRETEVVRRVGSKTGSKGRADYTYKKS